MKALQVTGIIASALLAVSCSVKEDRMPCPCRLGIDLQECGSAHDGNEGGGTVRFMNVTVAAWNDRFIFEQKVGHEDFGLPFEKAVPKCHISTSVTAGEQMMRRDGYRLVIPAGHDADEIWAHAGRVACFGESATDTARLHKQFARVKVKITKPAGDDYPCTFRLRSDVHGLDLRDLSPVNGELDLALERGQDDIIDFTLIRQHEDSRIRLEVYESDRLIETFPVDDWIRELGYSWLARDLQDIDINIDYAKGEISVKVNDWGDGGSIRIEI